MRRLGEIFLLQVQLDSIKTGVKPNQRYTPDPHLTSVPMLRIDADGAQGISAEGDILPDVHNRAHPRSKFTGHNGISLGFTGHYDRIRQHFGEHLPVGIAGEGIIVANDGLLTVDDLAGGIVIRGDDREIILTDWQVLNPCAPFSRFCLQHPDDAKPDRTFTESLTFLSDGMRGFQTIYPADAGTAEIRLGDIVYVQD